MLPLELERHVHLGEGLKGRVESTASCSLAVGIWEEGLQIIESRRGAMDSSFQRHLEKLGGVECVHYAILWIEQQPQALEIWGLEPGFRRSVEVIPVPQGEIIAESTFRSLPESDLPHSRPLHDSEWSQPCCISKTALKLRAGQLIRSAKRRNMREERTRIMCLASSHTCQSLIGN